MTVLDPDPLMEARDRTASSWILVGFLSAAPWRELLLFVLFLFCFVLGHTCGMRKFPVQGSNLSHSSDNAEPLTARPPGNACVLFDHSHPGRCYLIAVLICTFLMISPTDLFMCLLFSLRKCLFSSSDHFLIVIFCFFFFWCWIVWTVYFGYEFLISHIICKYFLPFSKVVFFGQIHSTLKFPGQESNPNHSCNLCRSCGNTTSLTCCATEGTPVGLSF